MEELHFYSQEEEIEIGGIDYTCEVTASASYQFIPSSHDDPPEELWVGEESEVLSATYQNENDDTIKVTDTNLLWELTRMLDTQELLKTTI